MPAKKPPKLVLIANSNAPKTVSIPGFGKFPKDVKPEAYWPDPFPYQFRSALFGIYEYKDKPFPGPFSKPWIAAWTNLSMVIGSKQSPTKCKGFFASVGYQALQGLADRGCDPNLVMSLFVQYLWDERVPSFESKDPDMLMHRESLKAVRLTRGLWQSHTWQKTTETEVVNNALGQLEDIVQSYVDERDFHSGRHSQNAKQNRVIFALHRHLKQRNAGPQWRLFLDLLVAAGAISIATSTGSDRPDGRIKPRIKVFERDHPKEARLIRHCVRSWPLSHFPYPPSALVSPP
jgi:hypothetical protein